MTPKDRVKAKYPKAYAAQDIDCFWHIWSADVRHALSGGQQDTRSAAVAWKCAADRIDALLAESDGRHCQHKWDRDGERCIYCGDKDWMGTIVCEAAPQPTSDAQVPEGYSKENAAIAYGLLWSYMPDDIGGPPGLEFLANRAREVLWCGLTNEDRMAGIEKARSMIAAAQEGE